MGRNSYDDLFPIVLLLSISIIITFYSDYVPNIIYNINTNNTIEEKISLSIYDEYINPFMLISNEDNSLKVNQSPSDNIDFCDISCLKMGNLQYNICLNECNHKMYIEYIVFIGLMVIIIFVMTGKFLFLNNSKVNENFSYLIRNIHRVLTHISFVKEMFKRKEVDLRNDYVHSKSDSNEDFILNEDYCEDSTLNESIITNSSI